MFFSAARSDRRNIRRIEKYENKMEHDLEIKQEEIVHNLELVAQNTTVVELNTTEPESKTRSKFGTSGLN